MRTKILTFVLMAGTVVGCASNPPPPPPMAVAPPPPPPAPVVMGPFDGLYKGVPSLAADAPRNCPKAGKPVAVRVAKNSTFSMMNTVGMIGPDGTITSRPGRGKATLSGSAGNGQLNLTSVRGPCTYTALLTKA